MKPVQISEAFDAPQFCQSFIEIAERDVRCRDLTIMVYAEKKGKDGMPIKSKRTGKPIKTWQPYEAMD